MAGPFGVYTDLLVSLSEMLRSIADPPNLRDRPRPGDVEGPYEFWFDGGAGVGITGGGWHYAFQDGSRVWVPSGLPMNGEQRRPFTVSIEGLGGRSFLIQEQSPPVRAAARESPPSKNPLCGSCGEPILDGTTYKLVRGKACHVECG